MQKCSSLGANEVSTIKSLVESLKLIFNYFFPLKVFSLKFAPVILKTLSASKLEYLFAFYPKTVAMIVPVLSPNSRFRISHCVPFLFIITLMGHTKSKRATILNSSKPRNRFFIVSASEISWFIDGLIEVLFFC